ncbi:MAG: DUF4215 domain-containing protein, partial [Phycisphaerae bacterium]
LLPYSLTADSCGAAASSNLQIRYARTSFTGGLSCRGSTMHPGIRGESGRMYDARDRLAATFVPLAIMASNVRAAELSVADLVLSRGASATLVVSGGIAGEPTYAVSILLELVPGSATGGMIEFTPQPPVDIVQLGDPWPGAGQFSQFDTQDTFSSQLNGSVDDNGSLLPATVTYTGPLSGFPVRASADAAGVWYATLATVAGSSSWEGLSTEFHRGIITICGDGNVNAPEQCDDANNVDGDGCSSNCLIESACCLPDGSCRRLTPEDCEGAAGTQTGSVECVASSCVSTGACCSTETTGCTDMPTQADCAAAGGLYRGDGTTCGRPGDLNGDSSVDSSDSALLLPCIRGPGTPLTPDCIRGDVTCDGAADLEDVQILQNGFGR